LQAPFSDPDPKALTAQLQASLLAPNAPHREPPTDTHAWLVLAKSTSCAPIRLLVNNNLKDRPTAEVNHSQHKSKPQTETATLIDRLCPKEENAS
jgi:hypothetical protein